jgi:hypothetical protein
MKMCRKGKLIFFKKSIFLLLIACIGAGLPSDAAAKAPSIKTAVAKTSSAKPALLEEGRFYVGLVQGRVQPLKGPRKSTEEAGLFSNGRLRGIRLSGGDLSGFRLGTRLSRRVRVDVSYDRVSGKMSWMTDFPDAPPAGTFDADFDSDVVLLNAYRSFGDFCGGGRLYAGGGLGASWNRLGLTRESYPAFGVDYARVHPGFKTNLAARLAGGAEWRLSKRLFLSVDFSALRLGDFSSAETRRVIFPPEETQSIGAYRLKETWVGATTLGLRLLL